MSYRGLLAACALLALVIVGLKVEASRDAIARTWFESKGGEAKSGASDFYHNGGDPCSVIAWDSHPDTSLVAGDSAQLAIWDTPKPLAGIYLKVAPGVRQIIRVVYADKPDSGHYQVVDKYEITPASASEFDRVVYLLRTRCTEKFASLPERGKRVVDKFGLVF